MHADLGTPSSCRQGGRPWRLAKLKKIVVDLSVQDQRKGCAKRLAGQVHQDAPKCAPLWCSAEQIGDVDDPLCDVAELQPLVHRDLAQARVGLGLAEAMALHQQAFRTVDELAFVEL